MTETTETTLRKITSWRWRLLVALAITIAPVVPVAASSAQLAQPSTYAYATKDALVVMHGIREVARERIIFSKEYTGISWTSDGRYVTILTDESVAEARPNPDKRVLVVAEVTSGKVRRIPCPNCTGLAPSIGSEVLAGQDLPPYERSGFGTLRFDLSKDRPPVELAVDTRVVLAGGSNGAIKGVRLLAGAGGSSLVGTFIQGCIHGYQILRPEGTSINIGRLQIPYYDSSGCAFGTGAVVGSTDNSSAANFAVVSIVNNTSDGCAARHQVVLLSSDGRQPVFTDMSALDPPGHRPGIDTHVAVSDLWRDKSGRLRAVMFAGVCDGTDSMTTPSTEWLLEGNRWMQVSAESIVSKRSLGRDVNLVVTLDDRENSTGMLYFEHSTVRTPIAEKVAALAVPYTNSDHEPRTSTIAKIADICPKESCLGVRMGDIDGDGKPDRVGLALHNSGRSQILELNIELGNGRYVSGVVDSAKRPNRSWLGISDINGDGRGDIVVNSGAVFAIQYRQGQLRTIKQLFAENPRREFNRFEYGGFTCELVDGHARLTELRLTKFDTSSQYDGREIIYAADANGDLDQISSREFTYEPDTSSDEPLLPREFDDKLGANCPGLDRFPR